MKRTYFEKLRDLARSWGGDILEVSTEVYEGTYIQDKDFSDAPFTNHLGVHWEKKLVVFAGDVPWGNFTHEMGHIFASQEDPGNSDEFDFFGWELRLVKLIRAPMGVWLQHNKDYVVTNDGGEIGRISLKEFQKIAKERIQRAKQLGLLDNKGNPISIRG